ncbi:MFS transporter [Streptomyces hayashii]|uniref:MFS transporter n=1 Tax=Streptomyces hayashii TaxID=2839966 RepID=UPI00403D1877
MCSSASCRTAESYEALGGLGTRTFRPPERGQPSSRWPERGDRDHRDLVLDGHLVKRYGDRSAVVVGGGAGYVGLALLHDAAWQLMVFGAVVSGAVSVGASALPLLLARHVPAEDFGAANGINALSRWIGSAAASAAVATLLTAPEGRSHPQSSSYVQVFLLGTALSTAVVVLGGFTGKAVTPSRNAVRATDRTADVMRKS